MSNIITCDNGNLFVAKSAANSPDRAKQIVVENIFGLDMETVSELNPEQAQMTFLAPAQADDPYWWEARETTESDPYSQAYWCFKTQF